MYKEPVSNVLGLKALAWDLDNHTFVSPARPQFLWSPGGLQMCFCDSCGNNPRASCTCGLYATFNLDIALEYIHYSLISPIFLVEASGTTHLYSDGFRSAEMSIHAVAPNSEEPESKLSASQARDYFQIPVSKLDDMIVLMDMYNKNLLQEDYEARTSIVSKLSTKALSDLIKSIEKAKVCKE